MQPNLTPADLFWSIWQAKIAERARKISDVRFVSPRNRSVWSVYYAPRIVGQYMSAITAGWLYVGWGAPLFETYYGLMQHSPSEIKERLLKALDKEYNVRKYPLETDLNGKISILNWTNLRISGVFVCLPNVIPLVSPLQSRYTR